MNAILLAQVGLVPHGIVGLAIWVVLLAALVAIVFVACRAMGIAIPQWMMQILMILFIAVVAIVAIKFLAGL